MEPECGNKALVEVQTEVGKKNVRKRKKISFVFISKDENHL